MKKVTTLIKMSLLAGFALTAFSCSDISTVSDGLSAKRSLSESAPSKTANAVIKSDLNPGYGNAVYFAGTFAGNWGKAFRGTYSNENGWTLAVNASDTFEWKALTGAYDLGEEVSRTFAGLSYLTQYPISGSNPSPYYIGEVAYGKAVFFVGNENASVAVRGTYNGNSTWKCPAISNYGNSGYNTSYTVYVGDWSLGEAVYGTFENLTWAEGANNVYEVTNSVKRRALVMGNIDGYAIQDLDIISMEKALKSQTVNGKPFDHVEKVRNYTLQQIKDKIRTTFADTDDDDVSYITISCHGSETGGIYIATDSCFTGASLRSTLDQYVRGEVVLLIDCCYAGNAIGRSLDNGAAQFAESFMESFIGSSDARVAELASERFHVICAANMNEYSYGGTIGVGHKWWEKAIGWDALSDTSMDLLADANDDGAVTMVELHEYSAPNTAYCQHQVVYPENDDLIFGGRF